MKIIRKPNQVESSRLNCFQLSLNPIVMIPRNDEFKIKKAIRTEPKVDNTTPTLDLHHH